MRSIKHGAVAVALAAVLASCSEDGPSANDREATKPTTATPTEAAADCQTVGGSDHMALTAGCWAIQLAGVADGPRAELDLPGWLQRQRLGALAQPRDEGGVGDHRAEDGRRRLPRPVQARREPADGRSHGAGPHDGTRRPEGDRHDRARAGGGGRPRRALCRAVGRCGLRRPRVSEQELIVWQESGGETLGINRKYVSRYSVFDVDGQRVVLVVNTNPKATEETIDSFTRIVESATFADGA